MRWLLIFALALPVSASFALAADAMVLSCLPLRPKGEKQIETYVDGFAKGGYPPSNIETIRVLARFGEDIYEFFPEQVKTLELRGGQLRIHLLQPLSADATAEMRFAGKIAAQKGGEFTMQFSIRNERREGQGEVRCTIE
jgi:hypothetical protein